MWSLHCESELLRAGTFVKVYSRQETKEYTLIWPSEFAEMVKSHSHNLQGLWHYFFKILTSPHPPTRKNKNKKTLLTKRSF